MNVSAFAIHKFFLFCSILYKTFHSFSSPFLIVIFIFSYLYPCLLSESKKPNFPGNCFNAEDQLSLITERKFASGPSYFTPTNTVSSTTIKALKEIRTIGFVDPGINFWSCFGAGRVKKRGELSVIGTTETAH
jgi:hypothetical protein